MTEQQQREMEIRELIRKEKRKRNFLYLLAFAATYFGIWLTGCAAVLSV